MPNASCYKLVPLSELSQASVPSQPRGPAIPSAPGCYVSFGSRAHRDVPGRREQTTGHQAVALLGPMPPTGGDAMLVPSRQGGVCGRQGGVCGRLGDRGWQGGWGWGVGGGCGILLGGRVRSAGKLDSQGSFVGACHCQDGSWGVLPPGVSGLQGPGTRVSNFRGSLSQ